MEDPRPLRRSAWRAAASVLLVLGACTSPARLTDAAVDAAVREALCKLSPQQRAAVVQRYYLGLSEREMSAELGCAPGTVKWHLNSARQRLKVLLLKFV